MAPKLPARWKKFVRSYSTRRDYWYQPKGLAVSANSIYERLLILREFEGSEFWRNCQAPYIERLKEEGISAAESYWREGGAPLARMLKQVFTVLGLAWIDEKEYVEITSAGNMFLEADDRVEFLSRQVLRYQFSNPVISSIAHRSIKIHPIPFLVRLLQSVGDRRISHVEYMLFPSRAREIHQVDEIADMVEEFRNQDEDVRELIAQSCRLYRLPGPGDNSMYRRIGLNRTYAYKMWTLSSLISKDSDRSLTLNVSSLRGEIRDYLDDYAANGTFVEFRSKKEFLSWMGDTRLRATKPIALAIYLDRGDTKAASSVKREMGASKEEIRQFKRMMLSEKNLEDHIEGNIEPFGRELNLNLELVDRQYQTTVGTIDLLARDKSKGAFVVIELKKSKTADRVFGQLSRYMGWVRKNLAGNNEVYGVIVGTSIDNKLRAARDAHDTKVYLVEFESKMNITVE